MLHHQPVVAASTSLLYVADLCLLLRDFSVLRLVSLACVKFVPRSSKTRSEEKRERERVVLQLRDPSRAPPASVSVCVCVHV